MYDWFYLPSEEIPGRKSYKTQKGLLSKFATLLVCLCILFFLTVVLSSFSKDDISILKRELCQAELKANATTLPKSIYSMRFAEYNMEKGITLKRISMDNLHPDKSLDRQYSTLLSIFKATDPWVLCDRQLVPVKDDSGSYIFFEADSLRKTVTFCDFDWLHNSDIVQEKFMSVEIFADFIKEHPFTLESEKFVPFVPFAAHDKNVIYFLVKKYFDSTEEELMQTFMVAPANPVEAAKMQLYNLCIQDSNMYFARVALFFLYHAASVGTAATFLMFAAKWYCIFKFARFTLRLFNLVPQTKPWRYYDQDDFTADWEDPRETFEEEEYDDYMGNNTYDDKFEELVHTATRDNERFRSRVPGPVRKMTGQYSVKAAVPERIMNAVSACRSKVKHWFNLKTQTDDKIFNVNAYNHNIGMIVTNNTLLCNVTMVGDKAFIVKHAFESLPEEFQITNPFSNIPVKKSSLIQFEDKDLMYCTVPAVRRLTMRNIKSGERVYCLQYTPRSFKSPNFEVSNGFAFPGGWHTCLTEDGSCAAPIIAISDGAIVGFHNLGSKVIRKAVTISSDIQDLFKAPVISLQKSLDALN